MFELRDTIKHLDDETDYKYDLTGMYEATELSEPEKKLIAAMIADAKDPQEIAGELFKIFNTQNAMSVDEDCEPERKLKEVFHPAYEELNNGDEIVVNGQHLYVADAEYDDDYVWVTDEKEDRYNKHAPGNTLAKYMIDEVIGQLDDDEEELDESWKDFKFFVKCNDGPKELIRVAAENKAKAEEYAKRLYAQNHTTYADDRYNAWSIDDISDLHEALHGMNEIEQFVKMANQIGLKTMRDVKNFLDREGDGKDILTALYDYLYNEIGDPEFQANDECWNCDPKEEKLSSAKEEALNEATDSEEWEEVAAKTVEDSDGFLTDYVWYTDSNKHVFVFGDSDIYRPEDGDFDWEIDIVDGKEAEAYKEAQEWFNSYNGFADENLDEDQDVFDIQGQAVQDERRKEVLDEFKEIFGEGENGEINIDTEETLEYVRGFLEDQGYTVIVSESTNAEHPIHIEWFK